MSWDKFKTEVQSLISKGAILSDDLHGAKRVLYCDDFVKNLKKAGGKSVASLIFSVSSEMLNENMLDDLDSIAADSVLDSPDRLIATMATDRVVYAQYMFCSDSYGRRDYRITVIMNMIRNNYGNMLESTPRFPLRFDRSGYIMSATRRIAHRNPSGLIFKAVSIRGYRNFLPIKLIWPSAFYEGEEERGAVPWSSADHRDKDGFYWFCSHNNSPCKIILMEGCTDHENSSVSFLTRLMNAKLVGTVTPESILTSRPVGQFAEMDSRISLQYSTKCLLTLPPAARRDFRPHPRSARVYDKWISSDWIGDRFAVNQETAHVNSTPMGPLGPHGVGAMAMRDDGHREDF